MNEGNHISITCFHDLLSEIYYLNERIMCGDIIHANYALPKANRLVAQYKRVLISEGAKNLWMEASIMSGGFIGVSYSYVYDGHEIKGSQTPHRIL